MKEDITLNQQEQGRVRVLNRVLAGEMRVVEAAGLLHRSPRQVRRLLTRYRQQGAGGVVHGNRGRRPVHATPVEVGEQIVQLARTTYRGCNQQHLRDLFADQEGIDISRATVHRLLSRAGMLGAPERRPPQHRRRRERRPQEGQLVQIDASPHAWLQDRGPRLTLVGAIDDATGTVLAAVFREQEDAAGYMQVLVEVLTRYGRPEALYHDRHSIFRVLPGRSPTLDEQLVGRPVPQTQFARMLEELEIGSIAAQSPQAKGRIERLWGTLQDRLVVELRLAGVTTREAANAFLTRFLPRFNAQFAVPAAQPELAYRPVTVPLEQVCCFKYQRTVALDNTVTLGPLRLQLLPGRTRRSYVRAPVEVHERLDGSIVVVHAGQVLHTQPAPLEAPALRARSGRRVVTPKVASADGTVGRPPAVPPVPSALAQPIPKRPAANHPWRRPLLSVKPTQRT